MFACRTTPWLIVGLLFVCRMSPADQLVLNDGTVLEGQVLKQGSVYWIKLKDGGSRVIPVGDVKSFKADAGSAAAATATADFQIVKHKADAVLSPLAAIAMWEKFLDSKPSAADTSAANAELDKWKQLDADNAEKINGKWVGGEERKKIIDRANALIKQATDMRENQTLLAIQKLEEAAKIYPNNHEVDFLLGYLYMQAKNYDQATRYFDQGLKLSPNAPDAMNNLAVAVLFKKDYARGLDLLYKAINIEDSREMVQNLINALDALPSERRNTTQVKKAMEATNLLAKKYGLTKPTPSFLLMPPRTETARAPNEDGMAGVVAGGTGFIIRDDGLILTNRHVVEGAASLLVLLPGNVRKTAEVVKIDTEQDLALIRVHSSDKLPVAVLAAADIPAEGAQCFAMGFPLMSRMGASVKITQGIVSGLSKTGPTDIITDAKVNPGNSGGPLLDGHGLVMGIVTMKSRSSSTEDSYGMALGAGRIRRFLAENQIELPAGQRELQSLNAEQVAAKLKPATVCILSMR